MEYLYPLALILLLSNFILFPALTRGFNEPTQSLALKEIGIINRRAVKRALVIYVPAMLVIIGIMALTFPSFPFIHKSDFHFLTVWAGMSVLFVVAGLGGVGVDCLLGWSNLSDFEKELYPIILTVPLLSSIAVTAFLCGYFPPRFSDEVVFFWAFGFIVAGICAFGVYRKHRKTPEQLEAEIQNRVKFYAPLSTFLDPYQTALVKFPIDYYEDGNPLKKKISADIETIKDFIFKLAPEEAKQHLSDQLSKGNPRSPDAILLTSFTTASLAAKNASSLPLSEMQAFLFALWHDLLSVSKPEDLTPEKIASYDAVPRFTSPVLHTLQAIYGEGVTEYWARMQTFQRGGSEGSLRAYIDGFSRILDREVVPHLARRGFQVIGYCRDEIHPHTYQENRAEDAAIPPDFRFEHLYVTGKTGAGKTTLLQNLISQDMNRGEGVIVLSPENDLFEELLPCIPRDRADDLIYFDPSDTTPPIVGFNPFHLEAGEDFTQKAGEVATIFTRAMGAELGVNMKTLFENAVRALIQYPGATIADFDELLDAHKETFRNKIIASPDVDSRTKDFFKIKFREDKAYRLSADRVLSRLDAFFRPPLVDVLGTHAVSFSTALNHSQRILFFNLSKLRGMNQSIMGQLLIAQIQQTFFQRDGIPKESRLPYHFYMDEFHNYAGEAEDTLRDLLTRVRKYKVSVNLSNQNIDDIPDRLLSSIIANVGSLACFILPADKALFFAKELQVKDWDGKIDAVSLQNLNKGEIFFRQPKKKKGFSVLVPLKPILTPNDPETEKASYPAALKANSKHRYGKNPPEPTSTQSPSPKNPPSNEGAEFEIE